MKEYEITYILDPGVAETRRGEVDMAVDTAVSDVKGTISSNSDSIRRRLAYAVKKQRSGFARTVQATLDPAIVNDLRAKIRKLEGVIRLAIIQTTKRDEVSTAIFEKPVKEQQVAAKKVATTATPEISDAEVEEKIKAALDEEVK